MAANIKNIIDNVKEIYMTDSSLETLLDYERVLDNMDVYAFANWKKGELVEGPVYEKYFVTCTWMYDYKNMPDPAGGERLLAYGCEITYKKDTLEYPITVKGYDDFKPGTKVPKMVSKPVWLVTLTIPKRLMADIQQGSVELENDVLDIEDVDSAQEENADNDVYQQDFSNEQQPTI